MAGLAIDRRLEVLRSIVRARALATLAVAALAVPFSAAQERGEDIKGSITSVKDRNLVVKSDDGRDIRIRVSPSTEVTFQDSGDRKLFPNPGIDDLRAGMGVHFNYNGGAPTSIVVHYVPAGFQRPAPSEAPPPPTGGGAQHFKARIQSIDGSAGKITADVAGRSYHYSLQNRSDAARWHPGDLVILTVSGLTVTNIESAELTGVVRRIEPRSITIEVDGREEKYGVDKASVMASIREGDRVRFDVEERVGGGRVVTRIAHR
jgi:hypothetical protein